MKVLRTPDARFADLPGYPFAPHYSTVPDGEGGALRIHHLDEGAAQGETILCLHGQPTWSYLYRKMIPVFTAAGFRVIAPDFIGFGRSDKPAARSDYSYARHVKWMGDWLRQLDLRGLTLFCQDWGGLIGLRLVAAAPERFARVVAANTALPDGFALRMIRSDTPLRELYEQVPVVQASELGARFLATDGPPGFLFWRRYCADSPEFNVGDVMQNTSMGMTPEVRAAYEAPFPDERYLAGARQFPSLVPIFPDDPELPANRKAWQALERFERPFLTAFSDSDPVSAGGERIFQQRVAGARGLAHPTIAGAGHFLQEDQGETVAQTVLDFIRQHPVG